MTIKNVTCLSLALVHLINSSCSYLLEILKSVCSSHLLNFELKPIIQLINWIAEKTLM